MHRRIILRGGTAVAAASALVVGVMAAAPAASAQASRAVIAHSAPAWLGHAQHHGKTNNNSRVGLRVYLAPQGGLAALEAQAVAVATPGSASYRQFVTPAQYQARYAPTNATVSAVENWLRSQGLRVTGVEAHHRYITAAGNVAAAQRAFAVSIQNYSHDGQNVQAPSGSASVPDSVAGDIVAIGGLDTTQTMATHSAKLPPPGPGFANARPCSIYYGQIAAKRQGDFQTLLPKFMGNVIPYAPCGYTGAQFRAAYEGNSSLDGAGVTVAIVDAYASPTIRHDIKTYAGNHGDASYARGQYTQWKAGKWTHVAPPSPTHPGGCGAAGWYGEQTLDVEAVHAMASGANIRYYGARSCYDNDLLAALTKVVDQDKAQLVTNSWGEPEEAASADLIPAYEQVFLQGALQGQSFMFSSGDSGDEVANTGLKQSDWPTSDPYVTSVGGTATAIDASGALAWQTGWGTMKYSLSNNGKRWTSPTWLYGSGGGFSSLFNRPAYQNGVVPDTAGPGRAVPDVAMDADPTTGMLVGQTQTFPSGVHYGEYRIGGTSLASPLFAGMTALTLQHAGTSLGLLNPTIYSQATSGNFTDVKGKPKDAGNVRPDFVNSVDASDGIVYSVRTFNQDASLKVRKGWDDVTGIGSPNPGWLTSIAPAS